MLELAARRPSTTVRLDADPQDWKRHRFGLPAERWAGLSGKLFWVTGAGTGFGRALSIALAAAGARVALTGRRTTKLAETIEAARALGIERPDCVCVETDLADPSAVAEAVARVNALGPLHGLVNNAAIPTPQLSHPLLEMTPKAWDCLMRVNVAAGWQIARGALASMGDSVRILFVTSEAGWASTPGFGPYNVSKAALNSLAASLGAEVAARYPRRDVQVNVLDPGQARTEMNRSSAESPYTIVPMALLLLSHSPRGPNGRFFHKDGRSLGFCHATPYERPLL